MRPSRYVIWTAAALVVVTLFRFWYIDRLGLVGDEAYYWLWSRHPDICYLDKGPVIAWFILLSTKLFGQTVFGIRFFAVILASGTGIALFLLARKLFSDRVAFLTVMLASMTPLYAVGSVLMTVDTVYIFFWAMAALVFWRAKDSERLAPWILTGALLGLSVLAKYTAAFELLSFALFCVWYSPARRHLRSNRFGVMLLTVAVFLLPVVVWNVNHGWPTSRFLVHRGDLDEQARLHPLNALIFLGGQAGVISPLLFFGILAAALKPEAPWRGIDKSVETGYLLCLFWPLFAFYFLLSFQHTSEANWPAAAYLGAIVLLAARGDLLLEGKSRRGRLLATTALAIAVVETVLLHDTGWLRLPHRLDLLDRARGWPSLAGQINALEQKTGAQFVIANKYMTASLLSFYLPNQPAVYMPLASPPYNQLVMWPSYREEHPNGDALLVSDMDRASLPLREDFSKVEPLGAIDTEEGGRKVSRFYLFVCRRGPAQRRVGAGS